jgi:hypothetical protein
MAPAATLSHPCLHLPTSSCVCHIYNISSAQKGSHLIISTIRYLCSATEKYINLVSSQYESIDASNCTSFHLQCTYKHWYLHIANQFPPLQAITMKIGDKRGPLRARVKNGNWYLYLHANLFYTSILLTTTARRQTIIKCCGRRSCINVPKILSYSKKATNVGLFNVIFLTNLLMNWHFEGG